MTSLVVRRFLGIMVAIVLTVSLAVLAVPAVLVQADAAPNANVKFFNSYGYPVSGDSFTNTEVTGNKIFATGGGPVNTSLSNVNLNLANSTSFDWKSPPPTSITGYNYQWYFGNLPRSGGGAYAEVGLNNSGTYTPGFDASRSADKTTFSASGTQTLTVSIIPREVFLQLIFIQIKANEDQYVIPTIESVTSPNEAPLNTIILSPDGHEMNILINNPTKDTPYTYTITIHLDLKPGVMQLEFMPMVGLGTFQTIASGSVTGTSVSRLANDYNSSPTTDVGTWTWSSNESITWNWSEGSYRGVGFQGYSNLSNLPGSSCIISGKVTDDEGPVANLQVVAYIQGTRQLAGGCLTMANGTYNIELPAGDYWIAAAPSLNNPRRPYVDVYYNNVYPGQQATPFHLVVGDLKTGIDFNLVKAGFVSGQVTPAGQPAPVVLAAWDAVTHTFIATTAVNPNDGTYTLNVPVGSCHVAVLPKQYGLPYLNEFYDKNYFDVGGFNNAIGSATPIPVELNQTTTINFTLTKSVLISISPVSATAGDPNVTLTTTGIGFIDGSTLKWCDTSGTTTLTTTFVSATQLTAVVPASLIATAKTADIWVDSPGDIGTTNILPFFVTGNSTVISGSAATTNTDPAGTVTVSTGGSGPLTPGSLTATASGSGTIAVAQYATNPGSPPSFQSSGSYFDVHASYDNSFTSVTIVINNLNGGNEVYWFKEGNWVLVPGQSYDPVSNSITITVLPDDLEGSFFGIANIPPSVGTITPGTTVPCPVGTSIGINASFTVAIPDGPYNVNISWGDQTSSILPPMSTPILINTSHTYLSPGVYTIKITVTDGHGRVGESSYQYVVVYNPDGGFVTGGGWIMSPAGAYTTDPSLTGKATFGFVSKYEKGATVPTGNTEFQFNAGNLKFKSTSYEWMVVAGAKAQFKGFGTINGVGNYRFMLTVIDGDLLANGTKPDTFRIRIWGDNGLVYDNQLNAADTADPSTVLGGGSIVIHK